MSILTWIKRWTGGFLFIGSIVLMIILLICGIGYLVSMTLPDEPELVPETGEYCKSKSEARSEIWNIIRLLCVVYPVVYAAGIIFGSAIVTGYSLSVEEKVRFK